MCRPSKEWDVLIGRRRSSRRRKMVRSKQSCWRSTRQISSSVNFIPSVIFKKRGVVLETALGITRAGQSSSGMQLRTSLLDIFKSVRTSYILHPIRYHVLFAISERLNESKVSIEAWKVFLQSQ